MPITGSAIPTIPRRAQKSLNFIVQRLIAIHPALVPYVRSISVEDGEVISPAPYKVMPSPFPVLGFQYRGSLEVLRGDAATKLEPAGITGLQPTFRIFQGEPETRSVLVTLQPYAAFALVRQGMDAFAGTHIGFSQIFEAGSVDNLGDKLYATASADEAAALVQQFLGVQFQASREPSHPAAIEASEILLRRDGESIGLLARRLRISERQLERVFRRHIGIGPKQFASLARFHRVLRQISANRSWAEVAADAGYSDQAHFIRSFAAYAGTTPGRYQE